MSWQEISKERRALMNRLEREFAQQVRKVEKDLGVRLGASLARLSTDESGRIRPTTGNIAFSRSLNRVFNEFTRETQRGLIQWLVKSVKRLLGINRKYFNQVKRGGPHGEIARKVLLGLGYDEARKRIISGGWLDQISQINEVKTSIVQRLSTAVIGSQLLDTFIKGVTSAISGASSLIRKFFGNVKRNTFIEVDRQTQILYANQLKLNHALYAGTLKDNTRAFCKARTQNVYTRAEIDSWNGQTWEGKIPNADVKVVCGGYNCRHHLNWISPELAKEFGNINAYN